MMLNRQLGRVYLNINNPPNTVTKLEQVSPRLMITVLPVIKSAAIKPIKALSTPPVFLSTGKANQ